MGTSQRFRERMGDPESGAAGKVFLVLLAVVVLLAVAAIALWRPVIAPLVGDAIPVRAEERTELYVPHEDPEIIVAVPADWVKQRVLFDPQRALLRSPDFSLEVMVRTWDPGAGASLHAAVQDGIRAHALEPHTDAHGVVSQPRAETLASGHSIVSGLLGTTAEGAPAELIVAIGQDANPQGKAAALLTFTPVEGALDTMIAAIAEFLEGVRVP